MRCEVSGQGKRQKTQRIAHPREQRPASAEALIQTTKICPLTMMSHASRYSQILLRKSAYCLFGQSAARILERAQIQPEFLWVVQPMKELTQVMTTSEAQYVLSCQSKQLNRTLTDYIISSSSLESSSMLRKLGPDLPLDRILDMLPSGLELPAEPGLNTQSDELGASSIAVGLIAAPCT